MPNQLSTSIVGEVKTTATIVDTRINDSPSFFSQISNGRGMEDLQSIPESLDSSTDSLKENTALLKEFGNIMPEMIKNLRLMNDAVVRNTQNLPSIRKQITSEEQKSKRTSDLLDQGTLSLVNSGTGIVQSYANGNMGGVVGGVLSGTNNAVSNLSKLAENNDMADMAKLLTKLGVGVAIAGAVVKGADVLANKYIEEMPTIFGTGRAFGDMSDRGAMEAYQRLNEKNIGTNLNITEFQGIAQSLRQQGVGNGLGRDAQLDLVGNIAARTGQLAYMTGGDANQYANIAGLMSRYGGSKDVAGDFEKLIAAGRASGLNDTQLPEFLSGIEKVMEDGIAKGFSRSATDVADTLLMFSKMSGGNAFWQGEQGAKILNQANAGLASATNLSKTTDILAYRAINRAFGTEAAKEAQLGSDLYLEGGGYVNNMMLLEQGLNAKNFSYIMGAIGESTTSKEGQIERLRQMFGVNYTGASRILQLDPKKFKDDAAFEAELKRIQNDPEMQNNETRNQKAMNDIKAAVVDIGEGLANLKISGMEDIAGSVKNIEKWLGMDYKAKADEQDAKDIMNSLDDRKMSIVTSNMKYYSDKKQGLNRLRELQAWNGFGRIPGILDDNIFNTEPVGTDAKTGESGEGAWSLDNIIGKRDKNRLHDFLKLGFGDEILKQYDGNEKDAEAAIKALSDPKNKETQLVRAYIDDKSSDRVYMKSEQENTLKLILEQLKSGINLNDYR